MRKKRLKYLNLAKLKERGWTDGKIKAWLGKPDVEKENPYYRSAAPQKLYLVKRVKKQEENKRFKEWLESSKNRREKLSKSLKISNEKKRKELLSYINFLKIKIPKMSKKKLREKAVAHYNWLWSMRGNFEKHASIDSDEDFLNRISRNMLRHECNIYEEELSRLFGKVGRTEGYLLLKEKIDNKITEVYPFLLETENR